MITLGDCLDPGTGLPSLADGAVQHVITDPPYCAHTHERRNVTRHLGGYEVPAIGFASLDTARIHEIAGHLLRVASRWVLVFTSDRNLGAWIGAFGDAYVRTGIWVKTDPMPQMTGDRPAQGFELFCLAHREGRKRWNGGGSPSTYVGVRGEGKRGHPTQKPDWLMEALLRHFTDPGEVVCDPFAGGGSTGVACRRLGRKFLGWEIDPVYHAVAMERIGATREQLGLWEGGA